MASRKIDALRSMSGLEAAQFFAEIDPEELVTEVRDTPDETLLELIGNDEIRPIAVVGILARLDEYAVPERLAAVKGVARFEMRRQDRLAEVHTLRFDGGGLSVLPAEQADLEPDVVVRTSLLRFIRIVSGERNAALEFLGGTLEIEGDELLALEIGGLFRIPGTDAVAVDPTTLDPIEVARVVGEVPADHLRRVMSGPFRPIVLDEIFRRLPDFVNPRRAAKVELVVALRLSGRPDGEFDRYVVQVDRGRAQVFRGADPGVTPHATVTCGAHDFLRLATSNMNVIAGVLKGQLKVRGDRARALQLSSVIDIPSAG